VKKAGLMPEASMEIKPFETADKEAEPAITWPSFLSHSTATKKFSKLFPTYWAVLKSKHQDFDVPVYGGYEWPENMQAHIPESSDYMSDPVLLYDAVLAYSCGSVTHLVGWPGTGKSAGLPVLIAATLGLPLLRLGLNKKGMGLDDLIGRESIKSSEHGTTTGHRDGVLCSWITHPCIVLADEFSRANQEITNGLMSLMERGGSLLIENREASPVIKRHAGCWIIASDNVKGLGDGLDRGMVGTDQVDGAVLDRFEITLEVDYLTEKQQLALIESWWTDYPKPVASKIVKFGMLIQQSYKKGVLPLSFSPRSLKEVCRYAGIHQDPKPAVRKVVLAKFAEEADISAIKEMYRTAFGEAL